MSTDIIPFQAGSVIPDYIREQAPSELTKIIKKNLNSLKRISIRAKVFRMVVGGEEVAKNKDGYMDVIIVNIAEKVTRTYYGGEYDSSLEIAVPPKCWSPDGNAPAAEVQEPIAANCQECPMNVKGSARNNSKACKYNRRLALVLANDLDSGVYQLVLPSKSMFGKGEGGAMPFDQYMKYIGAQNINMENVVTRLTFDDDADMPQLTFSPVGFHSREMLPRIAELAASPDSLLAVKQSVFQTDGGKNPVAHKAAATPTSAASDEDDDGAEPTVRKTSPEKVTPTDKNDLSDILKQFNKSAETDD
jgi:hypothetical protein